MSNASMTAVQRFGLVLILLAVAGLLRALKAAEFVTLRMLEALPSMLVAFATVTLVHVAFLWAKGDQTPFRTLFLLVFA